MTRTDTNTPRFFELTHDAIGVVTMAPMETGFSSDMYVDRLEEWVDLVTRSLADPETTGIIYYGLPDDMAYASRFQWLPDRVTLSKRLADILGRAYRIKQQAKPVIALVQGSSQGFAWSTCLWANYRIATETATVGYPELKFGLFPPLGALTAGIRLAGIKALPILLNGTQLSAKAAMDLGWIDQVTANIDTALALAKEWVETKRVFQGASTKEMDTISPEEVTTLRKRANQHVPAVHAFFQWLLYEPSATTEKALALENQWYNDVLHDPKTLRMVRTLHEGVKATRITLPKEGASDFQLQKLGIIGAGMMGSGIAYEAARAGISVLLKDVTPEQAARGKEYAAKITERLVQQQQMDGRTREKLLDCILPTTEAQQLSEADLIIEAVYEDSTLKAEVTTEAFPYLKENGFFASNTTSLPITTLAAVLPHPERFIGMHFFSPVDRMPLVEIIRGAKTSPETLYKALHVAQQLDKIPIVVHDGPAFFTSRIFFNYLLEAITMLLEGVPASAIEQEARRVGFAVGPLAVLDEISLSLMLHVYDQLPTLHSSQQRAYTHLQEMVRAGRGGRKIGRGFYTYNEGAAAKALWIDPSLPVPTEQISAETIGTRLLHVMALDSYRCLEEGVLIRPIDGDIGSILGVGYAAQTGGVFGHIDDVGISQFVRECIEFEPLGEQWLVPASLIELARNDFTFYTGFQSNWRSPNGI